MECRQPTASEQVLYTPTHTRKAFPSAYDSRGKTQETHDGVRAQDPNNLVLFAGENGRVSERRSTALDPISELVPLPRLAGVRVHVDDIVLPFRLVRTVEEKMVGVGEREVWDRREEGLEDHDDGGGRRRASFPRSVLQDGRLITFIAATASHIQGRRRSPHSHPTPSTISFRGTSVIRLA